MFERPALMPFEIYAHEDAEVKYSTVQNWYPGDAEGKGGIFNLPICGLTPHSPLN